MIFDEKFISKLKNARSLVFFTGAGISAESGIPTFRGKDGIWNKLKPEELANFNAFLKNPDMVWEWYQYRRKIVNESKPNPGHTAIKDFENHYDVSVVTQNVDNLHGRAGSNNIYELHGNIERNYCIDCLKPFSIEHYRAESKGVPKCLECGGLVRPDVVWFGEMLPQKIFADAERKAEHCDICFIAGTSAVVYPAAYIPVSARQHGAFLVEINIESTEISHHVDYSIFGNSGEILPEIYKAARSFFN
ncbi:MAG: NAD-dependent deacylase [Bacteroidetes bacterium]|nr:NAD-dependent deacylase [Bacteroidota bacterium]MBU1679468.1 NAD-dependent deacylase [Bacteroidota bacterium]MBU2508559.1 NAD-dependent deacylase [Bacteroidota bacterium]